MTNTPELKAALTEQLEALGIDVDRRKGVAGLQTQLMQVKESRAKAAAEQAEKRAAIDAENAAKLARIEARGSWLTFDWSNDLPKEEKRMFYLVEHLRRAQKDHAELSAKFAKGFLENPAYALSWGGKMFEHAGTYDVANDVERMFNGGATAKEIEAYAARQAMQGARRAGSKSTSMTSNLMEDHVTAAWAEVFNALCPTSY